MKDKENLLQKGWAVGLLATVCCFLWGSAFPCVKIGYALFEIATGDTASQILFAGARFTLAGVLTIALGSLLGRKALYPAKTSWGMIAKLSLAQTVIQYVLFYIGLANTSGVKASIIAASNVFFAILLSSLVFHYEKMGRHKVIGCLLGFAGVVLINLSGAGLGGSISLLGDGCVFLSTMSYALSSVLIKKYGAKENPVTLSGYQFALGGLVMAAAAFLAGGRLRGFSAQAILLLVYMAMISAVAYSLWGILLKYNPVGRVAVYGFMNPMFGVLLSALLLKEQNQAFTLQGLISLVLVCIGIFVVNRDFSSPVKTEATAGKAGAI